MAFNFPSGPITPDDGVEWLSEQYRRIAGDDIQRFRKLIRELYEQSCKIAGDVDSYAIDRLSRLHSSVMKMEIEARKIESSIQRDCVDMKSVCAALGFDPTNHHNAAKCPYCQGASAGSEQT